ncbi:MAG: Ig-like domain-containing protein [Bacteroidales bacterium]|nr:Ig-like domain-containing protein [Bacteroidales bacterium]
MLASGVGFCCLNQLWRRPQQNLHSTQTSGNIYAAFIIKTEASNSEGYFLHLGQTTIGTTFVSRVWVNATGNGVGIGSSAPSSYLPITVGTPTLIVIKLEYSTKISSLYVFNTFPSSEPATADQTFTETASYSNIGSIALRQYKDAQKVIVDGIRVGTTWADAVAASGPDTQAPTITFDPANAATNVAINTIPTITFNEAIRNIDDSEITDANVGLLVTLKEKSSGNSVTSTITINAEKKVITITPSANLTNDVEYVISLDPVEDANNNPTTLTTSTFTTISATTPVITLTSPNGGEKYYAGTQATITWESTNIAAGETITILVAPDGATYEQIATSTNDGTETVTIPTNAEYATTYKIKVAFGTAATDESDAFTVIPTTNSLAALAAMPANSIVKYTGKATITYTRESYNQKYIQDETGAILIHDPTTAPGYITETFAIGDGISNVEGKITLYKNLVELVPQATTGEKVPNNPTITPEVRTVASLTSADQSKLVRINGISFASPSNFATGTNYEITGYATSDFVLRTAFSEANYIGNAMPTGTFDCIGLVGQYNDVMQITPRSSDDIMLPTYTVTFNVTRNSTAVAGVSIAINNQTLTTDANGTASVDLANGTYSYTTTKEGYNEYSGSVTVNSAAQTVNIVLTTTGVNTNTFASLKAYPNPFSNEIRFEGASIARVTVTSIIGQVMIEEAVAGRNQISTEALPRGIYLVKFTNTKGETTLRKLVKE